MTSAGPSYPRMFHCVVARFVFTLGLEKEADEDYAAFAMLGNFLPFSW